jgi:hypothetical protein
MIALSSLKYLGSQRFKDSLCLFQKNRSAGAVYLMGYAVELALKRKISLTLNFSNGFPETSSDLRLYGNQIAAFNSLNVGIQLAHIWQIRNHKLDELLFFSGAKDRIISNFNSDWTNVQIWKPENRYVRQRFAKEKADQFIKSAKIVLNEIW